MSKDDAAALLSNLRGCGCGAARAAVVTGPLALYTPSHPMPVGVGPAPVPASVPLVAPVPVSVLIPGTCHGVFRTGGGTCHDVCIMGGGPVSGGGEVVDSWSGPQATGGSSQRGGTMGFLSSSSSSSSRHPSTCVERPSSAPTPSSMVSRASCRDLIRSSTAGSMTARAWMGIRPAAGRASTRSFAYNWAMRVGLVLMSSRIPGMACSNSSIVAAPVASSAEK